MADILASVSILVGILTAIYGMFYASIKDILDLEVIVTGPADNKSNYALAKAVRKTKVLPLLIGSFVMMLIFLPQLFSELKNAAHIWAKNGYYPDWDKYDTVSAAYVFITFSAVALFLNIFFLSLQFFSHLKELKTGKKN